jgi:hypothetical protein
VLNIVVGAVLVARGIGRRHPPGDRAGLPPLVLSHLAAAGLGLLLWIVFLATGRPAAAAWAGFVLLTVNTTLGDVLLTGGWRRRDRGSATGSGGRDYRHAVVEILTVRRPVATLHALLAGTTYFTVLAAAIGASS